MLIQCQEEMNGNALLVIVYIHIQSNTVDLETFIVKKFGGSVNDESKKHQMYATANNTVAETYLWLAQFHMCIEQSAPGHLDWHEMALLRYLQSSDVF